jgi:hypothetical protein
MLRAKNAFFVIAVMLVTTQTGHSQQSRFHVQEATIDDVHRAIRSGQITCHGLVRLYLNRAKAYNGVSNMLVTQDGAAIPTPPGVLRAGSPLKFPTETISIST